MKGFIEIGEQCYDERFTIITNLCYDVTFVVDSLQQLGFKILKDGTQIIIAGTQLRRDPDEGRIKFVQTSKRTIRHYGIICPTVIAKFLCITQRNCDGNSMRI